MTQRRRIDLLGGRLVLAGVMVLPRADHLREVYIVQLGTVGVWDSRLCLGTRGRSDAHMC
jgi:hypothetical protein